jgi:cell division inhibitor SepF
MIGDGSQMAFKKLKKMMGLEEEKDYDSDDVYYDTPEEDSKSDNETELNGNKMILLEPRAYSESQQIADHLKKRNSVVVNLKRVTSDQAKRIIDFLSGCIYAIGGTMQKVGVGIYLCAPNNISVQGKITEESDKSKDQVEDEVEW